MAMFDVRPVKERGVLDFERILRVKPEINLRKRPIISAPVKPTLVEYLVPQPQIPIVRKETPVARDETKKIERQEVQEIKGPTKEASKPIDPKNSILREFEKIFAEPLDPVVELAVAGAKIYPFKKQKPKLRQLVRPKKSGKLKEEEKDELKEKEEKKKELLQGEEETAKLPFISPPLLNLRGVEELENFWMAPKVSTPVVTETAEALIPISLASPVSKEIDFWLTRLSSLEQTAPHQPSIKEVKAEVIKSKKTLSISWPGRKFFIYLGFFALPALFLWWAVQGGISARENIIQNGTNAVANFEEAKHQLENLEFSNAANSFALAYDDLNKASGTLNELGASFLSIFGNLPGLSKVKAVNDLVKAGQNMSKAGESLALALGNIYNSNPLSSLNNPQTGNGKSFSKLLSDFKTVLVFAERNINKANNLLADIDESIIPEDKRPLLIDLRGKVPQFQQYIGQAIDYSDFLLKFIGTSGRKTYLVLLQNNTELRPTGGFPGTYAIINFEDGNLTKVFVDDIYQIDSNLKENIIPPIPMQHITPNWGMRDANWFADFPTSAKKVQEFYRKDGGGDIDGVLAITPDVIAEIFKIIGPIDMPEYGMTLNADNFLTEIQNEVEYEADRARPKKILTDLQPKFFEKLSQQDKDGWARIFKVITKAVEEKHILAYFNNPTLQETAIKNGLGGEIKPLLSGNSGQVGDYLQVVFANVKGSKTDFVTDNFFDLKVSLLGDGSVEHELKISRVHNGGDRPYGFYNKDNSAYIKVYVPQGSVLEGIAGQTITNFKPLVDYNGTGFKKDPDLSRIESSVSHPVAGVDEFEESGRTVFGFWLIVKPKQTKSVVLKYHTPGAEEADKGYALYWQKQSGTGSDHINFSFKLPEGKKVISQSSGLQLLGNNLILDSDLSIDRAIDIKLE